MENRSMNNRTQGNLAEKTQKDKRLTVRITREVEGTLESCCSIFRDRKEEKREERGRGRKPRAVFFQTKLKEL